MLVVIHFVSSLGITYRQTPMHKMFPFWQRDKKISQHNSDRDKLLSQIAVSYTYALRVSSVCIQNRD